MAVLSVQTKKINELQAAQGITENDTIIVELVDGGTRKMTFGDLVESIFNSMAGGEGSTGSVLTTSMISKVQTEDENMVPASSLIYAMNELGVVKFRDFNASHGYYGIEWDIDELMELIRAEQWDKIAHGDYFIDTMSSGEKVMWELASKNGYLHCGDQGDGFTSPHGIFCPRDCLSTTYQYATTNVNTGGYAASLMPANLEKEAAKFSSKLQGYMKKFRRLENNKGNWAWAERRITLPSVPEITGSNGFSDAYCGGPVTGSLPLFTGGNAHRMKGRGFEKKDATRQWYWLADPSSINAADFCSFGHYGYSSSTGASGSGGVAPLIVLA